MHSIEEFPGARKSELQSVSKFLSGKKVLIFHLTIYCHFIIKYSYEFIMVRDNFLIHMYSYKSALIEELFYFCVPLGRPA